MTGYSGKTQRKGTNVVPSGKAWVEDFLEKKAQELCHDP